MKMITLVITLILSTLTYSGEPTYTEIQSYVNSGTSTAIDILNRTLTKLSVTSCSQISSSRPSDSTTIRVSCSEVGTGNGGGCDFINNFSVRVVYEEPSLVSLALGLEKRVKIYTQADYSEYGDIPQNSSLAMLIEFSCDMKRGHFFQTGLDNETTSDIMEVYWDNSGSNPVVDFKYAGPVRATSVAYSRNSTDGKVSSNNALTFQSLSDLLTEFGINEYTLDNDGVIH